MTSHSNYYNEEITRIDGKYGTNMVMLQQQTCKRIKTTNNNGKRTKHQTGKDRMSMEKPVKVAQASKLSLPIPPTVFGEI